MFYKCGIKLRWLIVLFRSPMSLWFFCCSLLSVTERVLSNSFTMIVELSIFSLISVYFCFMYFNLFLVTCTLKLYCLPDTCPFYYYEMSLFNSHSTLGLEVYFVWDQNSHSSLLILMFPWYVFSFHLLSTYLVFIKCSFCQEHIIRIFSLYPFCQFQFF